MDDLWSDTEKRKPLLEETAMRSLHALALDGRFFETGCQSANPT